MKIKIVLTSIAVAAITVFAIAQQQPKALKVKSDKVQGVKAKGAAVQPALPMFNDDRTNTANPAAKAKGAAAKATYVHVDNATAYNVYVYIDDVYVGSVSSYGRSSGWQPSGVHKFYAVSAGGTVSWGPRYYDLVNGATFTWNLY